MTRLPRIAATLLALTVAAGGLAAFDTVTADAHSSGTHGAAAGRAAFHDAMRKLWEDHITWTRLAIVAFADNSGDMSATAQRLLSNQTDIGNAIVPFYGSAAGSRLSSLLHDHITIAVTLLQAAKAANATDFANAQAAWYQNANDIADFLSSANPRFWPDDVMRAAMKEHLDQTLTEAADELHGDYAGSVTAYDAIHAHILEMADLLSSGIQRQFPSNFR